MIFRQIEDELIFLNLRKNRINNMDDNKSMHRVFKTLCLLMLSQSIMLLILNLIPMGGEWASVCREWIEMTIGLI